MTLKVFSAAYLDDLVVQAAGAPRRRQHRNVHTDYFDPCQRLFNAIEPESYIQPHRHGAAQGAEMMVAVRGLMVLIIFDEDGNIEKVQRFGAGSHTANSNVAIGAEIPPGKWHTVVSLETGSVLLEVKAGPFDPNAAKSRAPWAPIEGSPRSVRYLESIRQAVLTPVNAHHN
jgi:cupin fold WbuC family metalloprotein